MYARPENREAFDCVATCFFIDTAHNVVEYLEIIHACLRPGGYWVNLGPLLYHWWVWNACLHLKFVEAGAVAATAPQSWDQMPR